MTDHPTGGVPPATSPPPTVGDEPSQARGPCGHDGEPPAGTRARPPARRDVGMATAEYAITTLAACGFAGLLLVLLRGGEVRGLLLGLVRRALSVD